METPKFETITLIVVGLDETRALTLEIARQNAKESNAELFLLRGVGAHVRVLVQLLDVFQHRLILRFTKAQPTDKVEFPRIELRWIFSAKRIRVPEDLRRRL